MFKLLSEILRNVPVDETGIIELSDVEVKNLQLDSRHISVGDLFIAYAGTQQDGRKYIKQAIDNGAIAVIYDPSNFCLKETYPPDIILVPVINLIKYISLIADNFFEHPSSKQNIYAVTGTNGKTSCAYFITQLLAKLNNTPAGFIGTIGYGALHDQNALAKLDTTTPSPIKVQNILSEFHAGGVVDVAMEASSHALDQYRINYVNISTAIFTNLTQDHLDYHHTLDEYYEAKKKLFLFKGVKNIIINIDDPYGVRLVNDLQAEQWSQKNIFLYSLNSNISDQFSFPCVIFNQSTNEIVITGTRITSLHKPFVIPSHLIGTFNIYNLLAVVGALVSNDYKIDDILHKVSQIKAPPGRMEVFYSPIKNIQLIVDYAHTPDALEKSLLSIKSHFVKGLNSIWCVFGCGGDRDPTKRPLMGKVAATHADRLILTDDNPRTEEPANIITDILKGFDNEVREHKVFAIINDRRSAIRTALTRANPNDVILIAGKGHEDYQIYGVTQINYNEREFVAELINDKTYS